MYTVCKKQQSNKTVVFIFVSSPKRVECNYHSKILTTTVWLIESYYHPCDVHWLPKLQYPLHNAINEMQLFAFTVVVLLVNEILYAHLTQHICHFIICNMQLVECIFYFFLFLCCIRWTNYHFGMQKRWFN